MEYGLPQYGGNAHYEEYDGFGTTSADQVAELNKALQIGYQVDPNQLVSGFPPLRAESVDGTLRTITYTDKQIKFWRDIFKEPAYSTVEQYIQLLDYGSNQTGWVAEGMNPNSDTGNFARRMADVKYLGTMRRVTYQSTLPNTYVMGSIAAQNLMGARWMVRQLEWALFWGNDTLAAPGNIPLEFSGLYNLVDNTFDMEGQPLTEAGMNDMAQLILDWYGVPTDLYLPYQAYSDLVKQFLPKERVMMPTSDNGYRAGVPISSIVTQAGDIKMNPTFFLGTGDLRCPLKLCPDAATHVEAPTIPASVAGGALVVDGNGSWAKSGVGGLTVRYRVTATNFSGESAAVTSAPVVIGGGELTDTVPITITNNAGVARPPEYFNVYREDNNTGNFYWITSVPAAAVNNNGVTLLNDRNAQMPGTYTAFIGEMSPEILAFRQLTPLIMLPLAQLEPSYRWILLIHGVPILFAPRKWSRVTNIGRL